MTDILPHYAEGIIYDRELINTENVFSRSNWIYQLVGRGPIDRSIFYSFSDTGIIYDRDSINPMNFPVVPKWMNKFIGGGTGAALGQCVFFSFDTVVKRAQNFQKKAEIGSKTSAIENMKQFYRMGLFSKTAQPGIIGKFRDLNNAKALKSATKYKFVQFSYKMTTQAYFKELFDQIAGKQLQNQLGKEKASFTLTFLSAITTGGLEAFATLWLDILKVIRQTQPELVKEMSDFQMLKHLKWNAWCGLTPTLWRNGIGTGGLFLFDELTKHYLLQLKEGSHASFYEHLISSSVGTAFMIGATGPFDLIKTRMQAQELIRIMQEMSAEKAQANGAGSFWNASTSTGKSARTIALEIWQNEGFLAFFRGTTIKMLTKWPQSTLVFALSQALIDLLQTGRWPQGAIALCQLLTELINTMPSKMDAWMHGKNLPSTILPVEEDAYTQLQQEVVTMRPRM